MYNLSNFLLKSICKKTDPIRPLLVEKKPGYLMLERHLAGIVALALLACACQVNEDKQRQPVAERHRQEIKDGRQLQAEEVNFYFTAMEEFVVDVAYESGAEPLTGKTAKGKPIWELLEDNVTALFKGRAVANRVFVPKSLTQMHAIGNRSQSSWSALEIYDLALELGVETSNGTTGRLWVVFLDGYYADAGEVKRGVLGASITGTNVIAIFKPAIVAVSGTANIAKFVEQSVLVHEAGHALGLVNNGLPLTSAHHDQANGAHCSNEDCVMYWLNEGIVDLRAFVKRFIESGDETFTFFGSACLADAAQYAP